MEWGRPGGAPLIVGIEADLAKKVQAHMPEGYAVQAETGQLACGTAWLRACKNGVCLCEPIMNTYYDSVDDLAPVIADSLLFMLDEILARPREAVNA
jgi:hypothetical protein